MEQVAKYRGELEWGEIPMAGKTVEAASLLPEGFRPGNVAAVIVRHGARSYAVTLNARVPATAEIVRDGSGQVCGIPAVAGGDTTVTDVPCPDCNGQVNSWYEHHDAGSLHVLACCECDWEAREVHDAAYEHVECPNCEREAAHDKAINDKGRDDGSDGRWLGDKTGYTTVKHFPCPDCSGLVISWHEPYNARSLHVLACRECDWKAREVHDAAYEHVECPNCEREAAA